MNNYKSIPETITGAKYFTYLQPGMPDFGNDKQ